MSIAKTFNQLMLELGYTKYVAQGDKCIEHVCCICRGLMHIQAFLALAVLVFTSNVLSLARQTCQDPCLQLGTPVLCANLVHRTAT